MASDERQETVDDVLREWRDMVCYSKGPIHPLNHGAVMQNLDRIEVALKRERAAFDCECAGVAELAAKEEAARHKLGNAAAMREALEAIWKEVYHYAIEEDKQDFAHLQEVMLEDPPEYKDLRNSFLAIAHLVDAALSAPARNCDIYPKRDDAGEAWNKTLDERTRDIMQRYPLTAMDMFIDWLLAYAKPEARGDLCHED